VTRWLPIGAGAAVALAALSLLLPYQPAYDPWGWLVWGRELAHLDLATASGPSWKPLPVLIDAPLSLLGEGAPGAWLLVARSGWLLAPLLAGWLAARLCGPAGGGWRIVAAVLAAASVGLTGDSFTPPLRQFTGGLSEGPLVALALGAFALALERRPRAALWLGTAASLLRPECWPFLAIWAWREVRREPRLRPHALAAAVLIPVAWFIPDLLAAGTPLEGSETARQGGVELGELGQVAGRALAAPLAALWVGVALFLAQRRDDSEPDRALNVLLLGALAWIALVAAMAVVGYAGLPRFLAPASAAISVVGAVGIARAGASGFAPGARRSLLAFAMVAALVGASAGFVVRAAEVPGDLDTVERRAHSTDHLFNLTDEVGKDRLFSCGGTVRVTQVLAQTALAWHLNTPIESIRVRRRPQYGVALSTKPLPGQVLGRDGAWRATRVAMQQRGPAPSGSPTSRCSTNRVGPPPTSPAPGGRRRPRR
jgi:MFS family permease